MLTDAATLTTFSATEGEPTVLTPGAVVAGRDEDLGAGLLDDLVVEHGDGVRAVVERRQPADRHVDDVDVVLEDEVDHALGEAGARCSRR